MKILLVVCITLLLAYRVMDVRERRLRRELAEIMRLIALHKGLTGNAD